MESTTYTNKLTPYPISKDSLPGIGLKGDQGYPLNE